MAVETKIDPGHFDAGLPKPLFRTNAARGAIGYAARADGQRFLVISENAEPVSQPAVVLMNWNARLQN